MRSLLLLLCASAASAAPCKLIGKPWLTTENPDAVAGQSIEIHLRGRVRVGGAVRTLGGDEWQACDGVDVKWTRVEPEMEHVDTPAPNKGISVYATAVVFGPSHGSWIGYDKIETFETDLDARGPTLTVRDARPSDDDLANKRAPAEQGLGVMRVYATVRLGPLKGEERGTAPLRYTFRKGDGFLGWLTSFYNVPYVFGSAGKGVRNQAERYEGADCADVLVAALRRAGWRKLEYSSVADMVDSLKPVTAPTVVKPCEGGVCAPAWPPVRFGRDARPGDLLALDYIGADELPRAWDHIVALVEDRGPGGVPDGLLGPEDLVADSGSAEGLKTAPLGEQGLVRVAVLRPRAK
jgi:hypothetical protein